MNVRLFCVLALAIVGAVGCDQKNGGPSTAGSTSASASAAPLSDDDVPVKSDFTEEAQTSITKDNYKAELDKLATEIGKE